MDQTAAGQGRPSATCDRPSQARDVLPGDPGTGSRLEELAVVVVERCLANRGAKRSTAGSETSWPNQGGPHDSSQALGTPEGDDRNGTCADSGSSRERALCGRRCCVL